VTNALVQHEAGRGADIVVAGALAHFGPDHQLFDLEAGGVGVDDVVGHDVQLAAKRHLARQSDIGGVFHERAPFAVSRRNDRANRANARGMGI